MRANRSSNYGEDHEESILEKVFFILIGLAFVFSYVSALVRSFLQILNGQLLAIPVLLCLSFLPLMLIAMLSIFRGGGRGSS